MHRRTFLKAAACGAAAMTLAPRLALAKEAAPKTLRVTTRTIEVNGREATVYGINGPGGRPGITLDAGEDFAVSLDNTTAGPTLVHWHGLTPPWPLDGVPDAPAPMIEPGKSRDYAFPVGAGGTYWMHAHTLQEQRMLAAPLIVRSAEDGRADEQEVVVMLHDFSFTSPEEILARLKSSPSGSGMEGMDVGGKAGMHAMGGMKMAAAMPGTTGHAAHMGDGSMAMDINDFDFDAYLANDRTLDDPEVVRVERSGRVRLRIVNAAAATAFTIDTGSVPATLIAVDGQAVAPVSGTRFPLSMAQRVDLRLTVPADGGSFPLLALREGAVERTGIVLATPGAAITKIGVEGTTAGPVINLAMEASLRALEPLAERKADRSIHVGLDGSMSGYSWSMPTDGRLLVRKGERVELTLLNMSMMSHPIHLHGHRFQVVAINDRRLQGALRDTVLVPPMQSVTIAVDADNPGQWAFHCHHLYHMAAGMMSTFGYEAS